MQVRQAGIIVIMGVVLAAAPQLLQGYDSYTPPVSTFNQAPPSTFRPASTEQHQKPPKEKKCVKKEQKWVFRLWS